MLQDICLPVTVVHVEHAGVQPQAPVQRGKLAANFVVPQRFRVIKPRDIIGAVEGAAAETARDGREQQVVGREMTGNRQLWLQRAERLLADRQIGERSEEHTSELQSLMRISYAVFCLKKKKKNTKKNKQRRRQE